MLRRLAPVVALFSSMALSLVLLASPAAASGRTLFIRSAVEDGHGHATLPLHHGTSRLGDTGAPTSVDFIILDTSSGSLSDQLGVNQSDKLNNAGKDAVQQVTLNADGSWNFPATVDFRPVRMVQPGPTGFPPAVAAPGAVGFTGYSPLVQLPNGTIVNAPHLANATGQADKVVSIDAGRQHVTVEETAGFQGGDPVLYISTDSSLDVAAALENATFAPKLNAAPTAGDDSGDSARASLAAFVNGQTGVNNPQRQGLNSALAALPIQVSPLNVLRWNPSQGRYSPLWDVHLTQWQVPTAQRTRQTDFGDVQNLADHGAVVGFNGTAQGTVFAATGFIVNCPIISQQS